MARSPGQTAAPQGDGKLAASVFWGLVFLLAWAPLPLASNRPWSANFLALIVGILFFLWLIALIRKPQIVYTPVRRLLLPSVLYLLVLAWGWLQTAGFTPSDWHNPLWREASEALGRPVRGAISIDPEAGIDGVIRLWTYGLVFLIAAQFGRRTRYAKRLVWCVALIGIVYATYGLVTFSSGNQKILWLTKWAYLDDLTSTFVSRAAYGAYAGIGLLACITLLLDMSAGSTSRRDNSWSGLLESLPPGFYLLITGCLILASAMVLTHSRGALVVTVAGFLTMMAALIARYRERRLFLLGIMVTIMVAGFIVLEVTGRATLGRALALAGEGTGRDGIHALTIQAIKDSPLLGWGLDSFRSVYFLYRDFSIPWESPRFNKAHNTYYELAMELGLIGFATMMLSIGIVVLTLLFGVFRRKRNIVFPVFGLGVTVLLGVHSILDFSIQMPAVAVTYAAILGVGFAQSWNTQPWERALRNAENTDPRD